jgi:hypothetical protein
VFGAFLSPAQVTQFSGLPPAHVAHLYEQGIHSEFEFSVVPTGQVQYGATLPPSQVKQVSTSQVAQ